MVALLAAFVGGVVLGVAIAGCVAWLMRNRAVSAPAAHGDLAVAELPAPARPDPEPTTDGAAAAADLLVLRQTWQKRRHDVRGALSPALLTADRLTSHDDEQVRRAGQIVVLSLQRAIDALADPVAPGSS